MFDIERMIADCVQAVAADPTPKAVREVLTRGLADPAAVLRGVGAPARAGITPLYRSDELTILNIVWGPNMSIMPHDHRTWAVIGVYSGREDNIFWRRVQGSHAYNDGRELEAAGAKSLCTGDVTTLGTDIVHSVLNPIGKLTGAIHIYRGDFIAQERSEWDAETLREAPYDKTKVARLFESANRTPVAA
jgi:predicted metal-dependent enzyme (double-stranded beta helix superfamily)